jgi:4-amino-4-deoxy-L-arabinose transferase-like glycosyltransferase
MSRFDRLAFLLSFLAFISTALIADQVFERAPHIEDEMTYIWQARVIARGQIMVSSPPCAECFVYPFVVDAHGFRFGKYPLGFPVVLAFGELTGTRWLINPAISGFSIWLTYLLVKKILDEKTALLAAFLTASSPFFLMNGASLLAHPLSLLLSLSFVLGWLDLLDENSQIPHWLTTLVAGGSIGLLALTRPLTAVGIALPFAVHGLIRLIKGSPKIRKRVICVALIAGFISSIHFLWQYVLTGNPLTNPYTLWWPYDTIGFGSGIGLQPGGYFLPDAFENAAFSLWTGAQDLFGWAFFSWLFLPFGIIAIRRNARAGLIASVLPILIASYFLYWIGSRILGPRYYYEALFSATMLSAAGIHWLAGKLSPLPWKTFKKLRPALVYLLLVFLVFYNILFYLPNRLDGLKGLYGISHSQQLLFLSPSAQQYIPALVVVHVEHDWSEYGGLLDMSNPFLDSPFIFTWNVNDLTDRSLAELFPNRKILFYYPYSDPDGLFTSPQNMESDTLKH